MTPAQRHMELVARAGCVLCNRGHSGGGGRITVHHIATGSGKRSDFATVGLCEEHHQGTEGFHGGMKIFCRIYRPPGETEWGLLAWVNEDIAKLRVRVQG
jgi:hypothetical protein